MDLRLKEIYLKHKYIIWPIVIGISSIIILVFVIIPQLMSYLNIKNQITDLQSRSSFMDAKADELVNVDEVAVQKDLQVVFTVLPTDQEVLRAMAILQNLVQSSGLQLQNTSFSSSRQKTEKGSFQLNLTVAGQINPLRDFLVKLQDSSRVFQIESVSVQFLKSKAAIEAEIPITVFYQTAPKSLGPIDQKVPQFSETERQLLGKLSAIVSNSTSPSSIIVENTDSVPLGKPDPFE